MRRLSRLFLIGLSLAALGRLRADVVLTSDGSRIVGTLVKIRDGSVLMHTAFAGDVTINQALVVSITTEHLVALRLTGRVRQDGVVAPAPAGGLQITGLEGPAVATTVPRIVELWQASDEDPDRRHWCYETDIDLSGKTGNNNQFGSAGEAKAVLSGPADTLKLDAAYDRQITDGQKSSDQFKAGADYADNLSDRTTAYVRDEAGFDHVMGISEYDIAALGAGYTFVKNKMDTLTGRAGLSYRYDRYSVPFTPVLNSPGADFEVGNVLTLKNALLTTNITFVPTFEAFSNNVITHETALEFPLTASTLHLKIGVSNDYNSRPPDDLQRLDTEYFMRLVFRWGAAQ